MLDKPAQSVRTVTAEPFPGTAVVPASKHQAILTAGLRRDHSESTNTCGFDTSISQKGTDLKNCSCDFLRIFLKC